MLIQLFFFLLVTHTRTLTPSLSRFKPWTSRKESEKDTTTPRDVDTPVMLFKFFFFFREYLQKSNGDMTIMKVLPIGIYLYRFIVDGQRRSAPDLPQERDDEGNLCNILDLEVTWRLFCYIAFDFSNQIYVSWSIVRFTTYPFSWCKFTHLQRL